MSYDPGDTVLEDDDTPFTLDALNLVKDASLLHFFASLEELIGHGQREGLLLSALGHSRDIDQRLLDEAKVPVYQKPLPDKTKRNSISEASTAPPSTSSTSSSSSSTSTSTSASSAASPSTLTRDTQQAELIAQKKAEAEQRKKAEKKQALKKWLGPLVRADHPPASTPPTSSPARRPSVSSSSTTPSTTASSASAFSTPTPITLLITNLALYILPPAIPMDMGGAVQQHFLILNQYHRIALQDILLVSLPYRSGVSLSGGDYALRINDFCLHLRSGKNVWLQSPAGRRSGVVEVLSDAYRALLGHSLQMDQPDYLELVSALIDGSIVKAMKQMRMEWWAMHPAREQGWLIHRSVYERPPDTTLPPTQTSTPVFEHEHDRDAWSMRWFVLTRDNYLLQFTSPAELEAFRLVMNAADSSVQSSKGRRISSKFPANFDCIEIDLTRAAVQTGGGGWPGAAATTTTTTASVGKADEWGTVGFGFEVLVFPRGETSGTPVYDKGHTRHLFTVIPPFSDKMQASWRAGDSPAQLLQELCVHYSKKPSVVIPVSSHNDHIEPPSPASALALQADSAALHLSPASAAEVALATQVAPASQRRTSVSYDASTLPFYPAGHPLSILRFPPELVDALRASTSRWFASVDDAINFNQMGGTRSAEDSVGARAAVKGRPSRNGRSPFSPSSSNPASPTLLSPQSSASSVPSSPVPPVQGGGGGERGGLFTPMVDVSSIVQSIRVMKEVRPQAEGDVVVEGEGGKKEEVKDGQVQGVNGGSSADGSGVSHA